MFAAQWWKCSRFCHDESKFIKILKTILKSFHLLIFIYVFNNDSISLWNLKNIDLLHVQPPPPTPIVFLFTQKWICWSITLHMYMNNDHNNVWNHEINGKKKKCVFHHNLIGKIIHNHEFKAFCRCRLFVPGVVSLWMYHAIKHH